jgi:integrase
MSGFTDRKIDNLKPAAARYEVVEDGGSGLAIRVSPRGTKTFSYLYRFDGKPRRLSLGIYRPASLARAAGAATHNVSGLPYLTLADARIKLAEARKQREGGVDPAAQAVTDHKAERQAETIGELCRLYLEKWATPNKRKSSAQRDRGQIDRDILPRWGTRKISSITRGDVIALLDDIVARGAPVMANRTKALLSKLFRFAVRRDLIPFSPVVEIDRPGGKEEPRQREPDHSELRLIWQAAGRLEPPCPQFVRLLMLLGQRRTEVAGMQEREIGDGDLWLIPASKMKGKVAQLVPLPKTAVEMIGSAPRGRPHDGSDYVLASRTKKGKHLAAYDDVKQLLDEAIRQLQIEEAGEAPTTPLPLAPWTFHDLRRSFSSGLARLGVDEEVRERLLAHIPEKLKRTYNVYDFMLEKKRALDLWSARLQEIVNAPANAGAVVALKRTKQ